MADISMCLDDACPSRFTCKRHDASGTICSDWQSVTDFKRGEDDKCNDYWGVKSHE